MGWVSCKQRPRANRREMSSCFFFGERIPRSLILKAFKYRRSCLERANHKKN